MCTTPVLLCDPCDKDCGLASCNYSGHLDIRSPPEPLDLHGLRVLFVDSDADTCTLFALLLGECRAIVHTAHTVSAARQIGSKSSVDVLITEVRLRDGDGCDLLDDLRRSDPHLRAAALTASLSRYDAERIRAAGFTLHLHKPVDIDHLVAVVATLARP